MRPRGGRRMRSTKNGSEPRGASGRNHWLGRAHLGGVDVGSLGLRAARETAYGRK
jgi:hypothetical protein